MLIPTILMVNVSSMTRFGFIQYSMATGRVLRFPFGSDNALGLGLGYVMFYVSCCVGVSQFQLSLCLHTVSPMK